MYALRCMNRNCKTNKRRVDCHLFPVFATHVTAQSAHCNVEACGTKVVERFARLRVNQITLRVHLQPCTQQSMWHKCGAVRMCMKWWYEGLWGLMPIWQPCGPSAAAVHQVRAVWAQWCSGSALLACMCIKWGYHSTFNPCQKRLYIHPNSHQTLILIKSLRLLRVWPYTANMHILVWV